MAYRAGTSSRRKGGKDVFESMEVFPALVLNNHLGAINQIILSGNTLVTSSSDGKITIWDYDKKTVVHEFRGDSKRLFLRGPLLFCVAFGAFGNEPGEVNVYNWKKKQFVASYKGHTLFITDCIFFEDIIVTSSADQTVRVWDAIVQYEDAPPKPEERAAKRILQGHSGIVNCLLWSGGYVWSGSADQTVKQWNAQTANCTLTLSGHTGSITALEASKEAIFTGASDGSVRAWDPRFGNCLATVKLKGSISQILFHSDHLFCVSAGDSAISQVHAKTGKVIKRLEGHSGKIMVMKATLHNLYTGAEDGVIRRWSTKSGVCWAIMKGHKDRLHSLLSSGASSLLSGSADTNTIFWDMLRHDDEIPAEVDEEEKWFQKLKAQEQKDQEVYANICKQRLTSQQKSAANLLAPPPALVPPPPLVAPTPTAPAPGVAALASAQPPASPATPPPGPVAKDTPKKNEKVSALDFLSEPIPPGTSPKQSSIKLEKKLSGSNSGRNSPAQNSPVHERPGMAKSGSSTGLTGSPTAPSPLKQASPSGFTSWLEVLEAASIESSEIAQVSKLSLADASTLQMEDFTRVGLKIGPALRILHVLSPPKP